MGAIKTLNHGSRMVACLLFKCATTGAMKVMVRTAPITKPSYQKGSRMVSIEIDSTHVRVLDDESLDVTMKYYRQFVESGRTARKNPNLNICINTYI